MGRETAVWYVMIAGKESGPLTRTEVGMRFTLGDITGKSYCWKTGMQAWQRGVDVPELAALFEAGAGEGEAAPAAKPKPPAAAAAKPKPKAAAIKPVASHTAAQTGKPLRQSAYGGGEEKGKGLKEFDTASLNLAELGEEEEKGARKMEFDTAHFKLADLAAEKKAASSKKGEGAMEFDTAHFRLADLDAEKKAASSKKGEGAMEFNTAHFKLADLKQGRKSAYDEKLALEDGDRQFEAGVQGYPDPNKPGSAPVAKKAPARAPVAAKGGKLAPGAAKLPFEGQEDQDEIREQLFGKKSPRGAADLAQWASSEMDKAQKQPAAKAAPAAAKTPGVGVPAAKTPGVGV
ncbi:MAG: DUF4339 domain-containing protein, partial [Deltaproteobacteria bacterium]|nr:DUF4339 domain-containing protein [Deltaproteobacteria bacterium]